MEKSLIEIQKEKIQDKFASLYVHLNGMENSKSEFSQHLDNIWKLYDEINEELEKL